MVFSIVVLFLVHKFFFSDYVGGYLMLILLSRSVFGRMHLSHPSHPSI